MKALLSDISQATLNIVYPINCQGCGLKLPYNNKDYVCQDCLNSIKRIHPPFCLKCGRPLNGSEEIKALCPDCIDNHYYFEKSWQCCQYEGLTKELIHKFKYNNRLFLKKVLVDILYGFVKGNIDIKSIDGLIPVPMHKSLISRRGFNQAAYLAKGLSAMLGLDCFENSLLKIKRTQQQAVLGKPERLKNIKGAFSVREGSDLKGKNLFLIDDVFTTGATADECSRSLRSYGVNKVYLLALARGI